MENELKFLKGLASDYQGIEPVAGTFYYTTDDNKLYFGEKELTTPEDVIAAVAQVTTNKNDIQKLKTEISTLVGGEDGQSIHDMIEAAVQNENTNYIGDKNTLATDTKATIVAAINEVDAHADEAKTASVITIEKNDKVEGVAAKYTIKQGGVALEQTIDIPKDMVVSSGEVVVVTAEDIAEDGKYHGKVDKAGTYIKLVLSDDAKTELFILVDTLVDIYKAATDEEKTKEIKVTVDNETREIYATLQDGGVTESKLANNAVTANKIAENAVSSAAIQSNAVTNDKLATDVQGNLTKASTALQKEDIVESQEDGKITVKGEDVAIHGLQDLAYKTEESLNLGQYAKADTALTAADITSDTETNGAISVKGKDVQVHGLKGLAFKDESELSLTEYVKASEITEGTSDGSISVKGSDVQVKGLDTLINAGVEQAKTYADSKFVWGEISGE